MNRTLKGLVLAGLWLATSTALAQQRLVPVAVPAQQAQRGVELEIQLNELASQRTLNISSTRTRSTLVPELRTGTEVEVCFRTTTNGYVSLWSDTADGTPARIYPNSFSHAGANARGEYIAAHQPVCVGNDARFRLVVGGRPNTVSQVYLHWTTQEHLQLGDDAFPVIGRGTTQAEQDADHASTTISYKIVE